MNPGIEDVGLVYYFTTAIGPREDRDILRLTAKFGDDTFTVWIKPSKPVTPEITSSMPRFEFNDLEMNLDNIRLSTVSLEIALTLFLKFLKFVGKKVLLVTHCAEADLTLLAESIEKQGMSKMFEVVIAGFSNSLPLFRQILSIWTGLVGLTLPSLVKNFLGKPYSQQWPEAAYALDCLEELVLTQIFVTELIKLRVPLAISPLHSASMSSNSSVVDQTEERAVVSSSRSILANGVYNR